MKKATKIVGILFSVFWVIRAITEIVLYLNPSMLVEEIGSISVTKVELITKVGLFLTLAFISYVVSNQKTTNNDEMLSNIYTSEANLADLICQIDGDVKRVECNLIKALGHDEYFSDIESEEKDDKVERLADTTLVLDEPAEEVSKKVNEVKVPVIEEPSINEEVKEEPKDEESVDTSFFQKEEVVEDIEDDDGPIDFAHVDLDELRAKQEETPKVEEPKEKVKEDVQDDSEEVSDELKLFREVKDYYDLKTRSLKKPISKEKLDDINSNIEKLPQSKQKEALVVLSSEISKLIKPTEKKEPFPQESQKAEPQKPHVNPEFLKLTKKLGKSFDWGSCKRWKDDKGLYHIVVEGKEFSYDGKGNVW